MVSRNKKLTKSQIKAFTESPLFTSTQKQAKEMASILNKTAEQLQPTFLAIQNATKPIAELGNSIIQNKKSERESAMFIIPRDHRLEVLNEINKKLENKLPQAPNEFIITYNIRSNTLSRIIDGVELSCDIAESGKRKLLLDLLISARAYVLPETLRIKLESQTNDAVSALKKAINTKLKRELSLGDVGVIEGKQGSGYRINPLIHIKQV
jgi:hypothetical protein